MLLAPRLKPGRYFFMNHVLELLEEIDINQVPKLMVSPGFKDVAQNGCVDVTKTSKGEEASPCPGLVACNAIASKSGRPMCGQKIGEWGFRTSDWENPKGGGASF